MLNSETKRHIDAARQVLVGVVPNPTSQINQITNALIYKFMDDMDQAAIKAGGDPSFFIGDLEKYSWTKLMDTRIGNQERMNLYSEALTKFSQAKQLPELFRGIFKSAFLPYRSPETLGLFLKEINNFDYSHPEELGNAYEYLLSIMSSQGDAGQFRTPRHIIDFMVEVVAPDKDDKILDPACGTAGFLISSYKHILKKYNQKEDKNAKSLTPDDRKKLVNNFEGYDIDPGMVRIAQVNMYLHQFKNPKIFQYDSLSMEERWSDKFDVILANPPFMSPKGGMKPHSKFSVKSSRSEVLFVDYIMNHLKPKGRAAIIVPEGIIFKSDKTYKQLRKNLVEDGLYAVVSLPSGVFNPYAGVKTSILFFDNEIARQKSEILFIEIENDGFNLGAQRRPIDKNDLPLALDALNKWRVDEKIENKLVVYVEKSKISESGDYNLSGDRYKIDLSELLRSSFGAIIKSLEPYQETFENIVKTNKDQAQKIQDSIQPMIQQIEKQREIINKTFVSLQDPITQMQKAFNDYNFSYLVDLAEKAKKIINKWPMVELEEICEFVGKGGRPASFASENGKIPFIVSSLKSKKCNSADYEMEALIIGDGGSANIHYLDGKFSASDHTYILKKRDNVELSLKYAYLIIRNNLNLIEKGFQGQGLKNVSKKHLKSIKIPLPPLEIQEQIVAEIDGYSAIISGAREIVKNWKPKIDIDPEWDKVKLGEICDVRDGTHDSPKQVEEGYPLITSKNIKDGQLDFSNISYISEEDFKKVSQRSYVDTGDIIMPMIGTIGGACLIKSKEIEFAIKNVALFKKSEKIISEYLLSILDSDLVTTMFKNQSAGATQKFVSLGILRGLEIPFPPLKIQKKIVEKIETERNLVESTKKLINIYEQKTRDVVAKLWEE